MEALKRLYYQQVMKSNPLIASNVDLENVLDKRPVVRVVDDSTVVYVKTDTGVKTFIMENNELTREDLLRAYAQEVAKGYTDEKLLDSIGLHLHVWFLKALNPNSIVVNDTGDIHSLFDLGYGTVYNDKWAYTKLPRDCGVLKHNLGDVNHRTTDGPLQLFLLDKGVAPTALTTIDDLLAIGADVENARNNAVAYLSSLRDTISESDTPVSLKGDLPIWYIHGSWLTINPCGRLLTGKSPDAMY